MPPQDRDLFGLGPPSQQTVNRFVQVAHDLHGRFSEHRHPYIIPAYEGEVDGNPPMTYSARTLRPVTRRGGYDVEITRVVDTNPDVVLSDVNVRRHTDRRYLLAGGEQLVSRLTDVIMVAQVNDEPPAFVEATTTYGLFNARTGTEIPTPAQQEMYALDTTDPSIVVTPLQYLAAAERLREQSTPVPDETDGQKFRGTYLGLRSLLDGRTRIRGWKTPNEF